MGEGLYWKGVFLKEIWKGFVNSTFMTRLSQATICPLKTDFSNLFCMQLNALLMSHYPYMCGSRAPCLGGGIRLSSSLAECDPALLSASEIYRGAAGLACGKQMVASWSSSLSSSFLFSLSLIARLHISADFAKPPHSFYPNKNTRHSSSAQCTHMFRSQSNSSLKLFIVILQLPSTFSSVNPLNGRCPVLPVHCTLQTHKHMHTLNNLQVNHSALSWSHQKTSKFSYMLVQSQSPGPTLFMIMFDIG